MHDKVSLLALDSAGVLVPEMSLPSACKDTLKVIDPCSSCLFCFVIAMDGEVLLVLANGVNVSHWQGHVLVGLALQSVKIRASLGILLKAKL